MRKILFLVAICAPLLAYSQLDITKRNITVTQNFHVRSDTVLNASEVRSEIADSLGMQHDSVTVGYGLNQIGPQKFEVDTGKVATLQALIDTSKYKQDTIGTIAANQIVVGNGINKITGNAGIASITANNFTFNNDANKTFGIDASASGTVGRNLTLFSGNSGAGTNLSAGSLVHNTGIGTGNAACSQYFGLAKPTTSGTATQTLGTYMRLDNDGSLNLQYSGTNSLRFLKGTVPGNGNSLGQLEFGAYWNGSSFVYRAGMYATALGDWSASNTGCRLSFVASAQLGTYGTRFVIDEGWLESKLANYFYWRATPLTDANGDKRWFADANYRARFGYRVAGNYIDDVGFTNAGVLELPTGGGVTINSVALPTMAQVRTAINDTANALYKLVATKIYKSTSAIEDSSVTSKKVVRDLINADNTQSYDSIKVKKIYFNGKDSVSGSGTYNINLAGNNLFTFTPTNTTTLGYINAAIGTYIIVVHNGATGYATTLAANKFKHKSGITIASGNSKMTLLSCYYNGWTMIVTSIDDLITSP